MTDAVGLTERWTIPVGNMSTTALLDRAPQPLNNSVLILGHGSGGHLEFRTTVALTRVLTARGISVIRFNFLYRELQKGPPDRMPRLMECFAAVAERAREELAPRRLILGGHSMGGRVATMLGAEGFACDGILPFAYPLHPAGQPEKLRDEHLPRIAVPVLCINGTRDDLCQRELMEAVLARVPPTFTMHWIEGADHSFHVLKRSGRSETEVFTEIGDVAGKWSAAR